MFGQDKHKRRHCVKMDLRRTALSSNIPVMTCVCGMSETCRWGSNMVFRARNVSSIIA
jgi:hypothetical protein